VPWSHCDAARCSASVTDGQGGPETFHVRCLLLLLLLLLPGYKIPRGGLFEYVSAANYTAETLEWLGYAVACGSASLAPWAFALATACNLAPRARSHHAWYKQKFGAAYPASRSAFIPFVW
jgi:hypothetical protein